MEDQVPDNPPSQFDEKVRVRVRESERSLKANDLSQGESLVPRIPLWWRLIILIIMIMIKLTKLTTMIINLWWRLRVTTDNPVAKVTSEIVTP